MLFCPYLATALTPVLSKPGLSLPSTEMPRTVQVHFTPALIFVSVQPVLLDGVALPAVTAAFPPGESLYNVLQRASNRGVEEKMIAPNGRAKRKKS